MLLPAEDICFDQSSGATVKRDRSAVAAIARLGALFPPRRQPDPRNLRTPALSLNPFRKSARVTSGQKGPYLRRRTVLGKGEFHGEQASVWVGARLRARAAAASMQSRSPAARHEGSGPRRCRRVSAVQRFLPDQLQRHRPQSRRAAALCGHLVPPCPRAPHSRDRRLLPRHLPDPADLGRGRAAVPSRDDAARPAAATDRHRPLHPQRRRRPTLARARPGELRLRYGQRGPGRSCRPQARPRPRRVRRHGLRLSSWPGAPRGGRRLRSADVRPSSEDRARAAPAWSAPPG